MKHYGYIRVSTKKQGESGLGLESQQDVILYSFPDAEIHVEVQSAKNTTARPVLQSLIDRCIKEKATLVVAKVDRLVRNTKDGLELYEQLQGRIVFLDLPSEPSELMLTMYFAFAAHERKLIGIRTKAALSRKRQKGEKMGFQCHKNSNFVNSRGTGGRAIRIKGLQTESNIQAYEYAKLLQEKGEPLEAICDKMNAKTFRNAKKRKWIPSTLCRLFDRYETEDQLFSTGGDLFHGRETSM